MTRRLSDEWRERADVCRRVACAAECPESDAVLLESQAEMLMQLAEIYDEHHPPGGESQVERLRREVEHWQACHRQEHHRELLLRVANTLRAVVHSSVGAQELLDLAEQLDHAMGDLEPRE